MVKTLIIKYGIYPNVFAKKKKKNISFSAKITVNKINVLYLLEQLSYLTTTELVKLMIL